MSSRDQRMQQFYAKVRAMVREHGWIVQGVMPTAADPPGTIPFAYTIGLTDAGLPELIISWPGQPGMARDLLNNAAGGHLKDEIQHGQILDYVANIPSRAIAADPHKAEIQQAYNYVNDPDRVRDKIRLIQILWPDANGRFPDEDGYNFVDFPQEMWPLAS